MEFGSGLDFATFMNSAIRNNEDGMWSGNGGLLWIFLLFCSGVTAECGAIVMDRPRLM